MSTLLLSSFFYEFAIYLYIFKQTNVAKDISFLINIESFYSLLFLITTFFLIFKKKMDIDKVL